MKSIKTIKTTRHSLTILGTGYVGSVAGACFASKGHTVTGVDCDDAPIQGLQRGQVPFHEPRLARLVRGHVQAGRLWFTTDTAVAVRGGAIIFLCVGTPPAPDGSADLRLVRDAAGAVARAANGPKILDLFTTRSGDPRSMRRSLTTDPIPGPGSRILRSVSGPARSWSNA